MTFKRVRIDYVSKGLTDYINGQKDGLDFLKNMAIQDNIMDIYIKGIFAC